jgi:Polyketide cyclase / dehydrase and lipid transport
MMESAMSAVRWTERQRIGFADIDQDRRIKFSSIGRYDSEAPHRLEGGSMPAVVESIEISRRPEDVFAYATDFAHFPEWQGGVLSARPEGDAPLAVGSRAVVTRRIGPRERPATEEITELNPPRTWAVRGVGGRLAAIAKGTIQPLDGASGRAS